MNVTKQFITRTGKEDPKQENSKTTVKGEGETLDLQTPEIKIEDFSKSTSDIIKEVREKFVSEPTEENYEKYRRVRNLYTRTGSQDRENDIEESGGYTERKTNVRKTLRRNNNTRNRKIRQRSFNQSYRGNGGLGSRSLSRNVTLKTQAKINNYKIIKQMKKDSNNISRNFGYESPMPWLSEEIISLNGIDHVLIRGSEFLTSVSVTTEAASAGQITNPGDCIYTVPINPVFFSGTRLNNMARNYQKYCYRRLTVEFVPLVPSTFGGAICQFFTYDPNENDFIAQNSDTRLRDAMSHLGASMTNVYSYARTHIVEDGQLDCYFLDVNGDPRLEEQGTFFLLAGSTFPGDGGNSYYAIGNLILHYELELKDRGMENTDSQTTKYLTVITTTITTWFSGITANAPMYIKTASFNTGISPPAEPYNLFVMVITKQLRDDTAGTSIIVDTEVSENTTLFGKGSVWYLKLMEDPSLLGIYTNIGDALTSSNTVICANNLTGGNNMSMDFTLYQYDFRNDG